MKDHHIPQLVNKITNDLRLNIPNLPASIRGVIGLSVSQFMHDVVDVEADTSETAKTIHITPDRYGCTDHGCIFQPPVGMGTNGGCSCLRDIRPATLQIQVEKRVRAMKSDYDTQINELIGKLYEF